MQTPKRDLVVIMHNQSLLLEGQLQNLNNIISVKPECVRLLLVSLSQTDRFKVLPYGMTVAGRISRLGGFISYFFLWPIEQEQLYAQVLAALPA